jgi:hypothetical protein
MQESNIRIRIAVMTGLAWAAVAAGSVALAQRDTGSMGGAGVTVFAEANFRGINSHFLSDVPDLRKFGLNDRVDSLQIPRGETWEVCENINYGGRCQVFSGNESDLARVGWGGLVSSLRRIERTDNRWGRGPTGPVSATRPRLVVFDDINYGGQSAVLTDPSGTLGTLNSRVSSLKVYGGAWELCDAPDFRGRCRTISDNVADLRGVGLQDVIKSARPAGVTGQRSDERSGEGNMGGGTGVNVFSEANFHGMNANFRTNVPDLRQFNMNDRVDSLQITRGETWEVCQDINYRGRCQVFSGNEPDLARVGWGGLVSSLRRIDRNDSRWGGGPTGPHPPMSSRLVVFDDINYRGQAAVLTGPNGSMRAHNNRISSVKVYGGAWEVCDGLEFKGRCRTITSNIPDLRSAGMQDIISSARPVAGGRGR